MGARGCGRAVLCLREPMSLLTDSSRRGQSNCFLIFPFLPFYSANYSVGTRDCTSQETESLCSIGRRCCFALFGFSMLGSSSLSLSTRFVELFTGARDQMVYGSSSSSIHCRLFALRVETFLLRSCHH